MNSKEFAEYIQEIFEQYENTKKEHENETNITSDVLLEIASEYSMNTTYIHDDNELDKNDYYIVRKIRDSLQDALNCLAVAITNEHIRKGA